LEDIAAIVHDGKKIRASKIKILEEAEIFPYEQEVCL
jgi:hypothetical protein